MWRHGSVGLALTVVLLALMGGGRPSDSAPTAPVAIQTVEGRGAILRGDQAAARQRALMTSLRQALEVTVADLLEADIRVSHVRQLEQQLYQHAPRYIRSYRVLWEYPDVVNQVYRIAVEAEMDVVHINRALVRLGMAPAGVTPLRLLVLIEAPPAGVTDVSLRQPATRLLTQVVRQHVDASRVRVLDPEPSAVWNGDDTSALLAGRAAGADVVLVGQASLRRMRDDVAGMALHAVQAVAHLRLLVTETGISLASERASETVDHRDSVLAAQQAFERVAATLIVRLMPMLQAYEQRHASRSNAFSGASEFGHESTTRQPNGR